MKSLKILLLVALVCAASLNARADASFQASLWAPDHQLVPATESVSGFRLELYGENKNMTGFEIGLFNITTGNFSGVTGLLPTAYNRVDGTTKGIQFGIVNETKGEVVGWQHGVVNLPSANITGLQMGILNWHETVLVDVSGVQFGLVNTSKRVTGLQIGLVNYAQSLKGVQIGLWNEVESRNWDDFHPLPKVFPIINLGF